MKEDAVRTRFTRSSEALDTHARPLLDLTLGDRVFVQNQNRHHPTKWDKSGTIVDQGDNDQFWVKVDGSGRLTLRNRRFLRKYTQHTMAINYSPNIIPPSQILSQSPKLKDSVVNPQRSHTDNTTTKSGGSRPSQLQDLVVNPQRSRPDSTTRTSSDRRSSERLGS